MIFLELFWTFLKIGALTFGGGYAMIAIMQSEIVSHGWMTDTMIADYVAISESTPGPLAINMATAVGSQMGNQDYGFLGSFFGAFAATLGTVLPSFVIILLVARWFESFKDNRIVKSCMNGLKPAVVGLIGSALISIGSAVFFPTGTISLEIFSELSFYASLVIFAIALVLAFKKIHPIAIIGISATLGIACGYLLPR